MSEHSNHAFLNEYAVDFTQSSKVLAYSRAATTQNSKLIFSGDVSINAANITRCLPKVLDPLLADF